MTSGGERPLGLRAALGSVNPQARILLGGILLVSISNFMVSPLLALYLSVARRETAPAIGLVLTALIVTQQGLPLLTGVLSDRLGARRMLAAGAMGRALGYVGFALARDQRLLLASALLVGASGAAFTPAAKAMIVHMAGGRRTAALALRNAAVNGGAAVGPLIGGLLFGRFQLVCLAAATIYLCFWWGLRQVIPAIPAAGPARPPLRLSLASLASDVRLWTLTLASVGFWYVFTQFTFTVPLYAHDRLGLDGGIGLLFTLNAVVVMGAQYPVVVTVSGRLGSWKTLAAGAAALAAAFTLLALPGGLGVLVLFALIFSLGELLVVPTLDSLAAELAPAAAVGGYLGVVAAGWAVGGLLGNLVGGTLYGRLHADPAAIWLATAGVSLVTAAAFLLASRTPAGRGAGLGLSSIRYTGR